MCVDLVNINTRTIIMPSTDFAVDNIVHARSRSLFCNASIAQPWYIDGMLHVA